MWKLGLALGLFTLGDQGVSVFLFLFPPSQTLIQTVFPRSARAALVCVLVNSLLCIFPAGFLCRQWCNENVVDALLCKCGSPSPSCGAQDEAQWQTGCPGTAGSLSLPPLAERPKSISEYVAKSSFLFLHKNLMKMGNEVHWTGHWF